MFTKKKNSSNYKVCDILFQTLIRLNFWLEVLKKLQLNLLTEFSLLNIHVLQII